MPTPLRYTAVVPVKRTGLAKTRLADIDDGRRRALALAFALDTVEALRACPAVAAVLVVTDDDQAAHALTQAGASVVGDEPDAGLNPALQHGAAVAAALHPRDGVLLVSADLPALRPDQLVRALADASGHDRAFVPDAAGTGTTMLAVRPGVDPDPQFGPRSRAAHRRSGAVEIDRRDITSLRRDVDTIVDLWDARRLGVGSATAATLADLADLADL